MSKISKRSLDVWLEEELFQKPVQTKGEMESEEKIKEEQTVPSPHRKWLIIGIGILAIIIILAAAYILWPKPILEVRPDVRNFRWTLPTGTKDISTLEISNRGSGTLNWHFSVKEPSTELQQWITLYYRGSNVGQDAYGTNSDEVQVVINTAGLRPGNYYAEISVSSNGGNIYGTIGLTVT